MQTKTNGIDLACSDETCATLEEGYANSEELVLPPRVFYVHWAVSIMYSPVRVRVRVRAHLLYFYDVKAHNHGCVKAIGITKCSKTDNVECANAVTHK